MRDLAPRSLDHPRMVWLALACLLVPTPAAAEPPAVDRTSGCRFHLPRGLDGSHGAFWYGQCRAGWADGLGVLKTRPDLATRHLFMGEVRKGQPIIGIILGEADILFIEPTETPTSETEYLDIYGHASLGAQAASEWFKARHNRASAAYYERLSVEYGNAGE